MFKIKQLFWVLLIVLALSGMAIAAEVPTAEQVEETEDAMEWLIGPSAPKKTVAVFIETGATPIDRNGKPKELIEAKLNELLPSDKFAFLPLDETEQKLMDYKEDNGIIVNEFFSGRASREGFQEVCNSIGDVDYALIVYVANDIPKGKTNMLGFGASFSMKVACDVRLLDIATGEYVARAKAEEIGKNSSAVAVVSAPSPDRAFLDGLIKALDKIKLDVSRL